MEQAFHEPDFTLLLVDDEQTLSELTREYLAGRGFKVHVCNEPEKATMMLETHQPDLCILDVKMPGIDGFSLAARILDLQPAMPFIFLTGLALRDDRIKGLSLGADDYISKPFSMEELYLRITAVLKRVYSVSKHTRKQQAYSLGNHIHFDAERRELQAGHQVMRLTAMENKLLVMLCEARNNQSGGVLQRDAALKAIWGDNDIYKGRSMNVYITKLRGLLKADPSVEILNVHGEGYQLCVKEPEI
jgi:two-component system, OmpR family, response regulator